MRREPEDAPAQPDPGRAGRRPQLVPAHAGEQRSAGGAVEHREVEGRIERPEQAVPLEHAARVRPDGVELVADLEPHPVGGPEMLDDPLLPLRLVRVGDVGRADRDRHGLVEPLAPRHAHSRRQDGGGVAASRERDEAPAAQQRRANRRIQRLRGSAGGTQPERPAGDAEHDAGRDLERRQPAHGASRRIST
jgi:hypothetical protein